MDVFRLVQLICGVLVSLLGTMKAWLEWKAMREQRKGETSESGDASQRNPRS
ncbi:hypothetical protein C7445_1435 [Alicyclobacillus sacchari]|uniref:Uncharacterized protein n=1 Tax=Alicyclobacillus sacchari TaxID=392010 RepID=A0A4R8L596_9BACL|nr:hypothetical protein C7445_1435 [Alicyclobacillus sacchari]GMA59350.1 hypothetical protein GCM10025858_38530 [Alicyclobacillus sacchari]GMA59451.1 hypothetical protein GCM10025858_39550 [Alicyclobacillus sacchari]GMA59541.1 hypothetical protein GCM10025858_40450 [Alicyclobacillus sacchari]